ncbi:uncharacterized protein LOC133727219 [Rosa rugosa]|uniref:uncharacterized protein LOC133727219 n=1 Tax=Rosa rugosa TaxID=74645 RepID=UPI002B402265|nr:uncharacterized protein LOC133727219 [Rosa rugosa]
MFLHTFEFDLDPLSLKEQQSFASSRILKRSPLLAHQPSPPQLHHCQRSSQLRFVAARSSSPSRKMVTPEAKVKCRRLMPDNLVKFGDSVLRHEFKVNVGGKFP